MSKEVPERIVCHSKFVQDIARQFGWKSGARYTNLRDVRHLNDVFFIDIDWKRYDFDRHRHAVKTHQPALTVERKAFLVEVYKQMFSDINRHLTVIWQSVSVVVGAFALLALSEKGVVPADVAISLIILLSGWLYAHMLDAGYWYNRNLVIIANIERQFLDKSDLKDIYFYWGKHRSVKNKMITHIRIQAVLGSALASLVLAFHFFTRVWDGLWEPLSAFDPVRMLPYLASLTMLALCVHLKRDRDAAYANFRTNSPGIDVDTSGIVFGTGHTVDK